MGFVPFMTKDICKFFICLVNVLVIRMPCFDLELACGEYSVDLIRNSLASRFVLTGASNVINIDMSLTES